MSLADARRRNPQAQTPGDGGLARSAVSGYGQPLPTLEELGGAPKEHTHALPTLSALGASDPGVGLMTAPTIEAQQSLLGIGGQGQAAVLLVPKVDVITATGTWTPPSNLHGLEVVVTACGAGGGSRPSSTQHSHGGHPGEVVWRKRVTLPDLSAVPVVVPPSVGMAANISGGSCTFGSHVTARGGRGSDLRTTAPITLGASTPWGSPPPSTSQAIEPERNVPFGVGGPAIAAGETAFYGRSGPGVCIVEYFTKEQG